MTDTILKELQGLNRPFKYVVTTIIMQKNGAGMDTGAAMHWDANKDGLVCIPWENGEMHVVADDLGVSLNVDNVGRRVDSRVCRVCLKRPVSVPAGPSPDARPAPRAHGPARRVPALPYTTVGPPRAARTPKIHFVRWPAIDAETPISRARRAAQPVTASYRRSSEAAPRTPPSRAADTVTGSPFGSPNNHGQGLRRHGRRDEPLQQGRDGRSARPEARARAGLRAAAAEPRETAAAVWWFAAGRRAGRRRHRLEAGPATPPRRARARRQGGRARAGVAARASNRGRSPVRPDADTEEDPAPEARSAERRGRTRAAGRRGGRPGAPQPADLSQWKEWAAPKLKETASRRAINMESTRSGSDRWRTPAAGAARCAPRTGSPAHHRSSSYSAYLFL